MPSPEQVFRDMPNKHKTLLALWPELHAAFVGDGKPEAEREAPKVYCALGDCSKQPRDVRPQAVARTFQFGHPACAMHLNLYADRPGGWPLDRKANR